MHELEKKLLTIKWSEEKTKIRQVMQLDSQTFKYIGIFFLAAAIGLIFYYPAFSMILGPAGVLALIAHNRNKSKLPILEIVEIKESHCWETTIRGNYVKDPSENIRRLYTWNVVVNSSFYIQDLRVERLEKFSKEKVVQVNPEMHRSFSEGNVLMLMFSPSDDLIAYGTGETFTYLVKNEVLSNGELYPVSVSIPQGFTNPLGSGYRKVQ